MWRIAVCLLLAAVSALAVVSWIRSYDVTDQIDWSTNAWRDNHRVGIGYNISAIQGLVTFGREFYPAEYEPEMGDLTAVEFAEGPRWTHANVPDEAGDLQPRLFEGFGYSSAYLQNHQITTMQSRTGLFC
jgi:hypothetical protein